jgi:peptide/nickel transport system substrate-binding protein
MEPLRASDPRRIGRYTLVARLGAGGMGRVYLGFSPAGRPIAVKVVYQELARDRAFINRFRQEVAAARRVSGAYTAAVVDAGDGDPPWLATTLVMGPSLDDAVEQQGLLPEVSVWRLAAGLAEALAEVHSCGLVHRDLKPSNVLLAVDGPRVIDFGISRALDGTAMTGTGIVVGTPGFMSPEQATGLPVGPASDVFSFGGVVTFAATGSGAFGQGNPAAMLYRVVHGEPLLSGLPPALADLVRHCLAKRPDDRATLPELMEIITANLTPVTSATSFWPPALARFIEAYQARFTADTPGWSAPVTPAPPMPVPDRPTPVPEPSEPPTPVPPPAAWPPTVTSQQLAPGPPAVTPPPATGRPAVTPPPFPGPPMATPPFPGPPMATAAGGEAPPLPYIPPASPPGRPPRRRATLIAGIGAAAAAVVAAVVVLATSLSSGHPQSQKPSHASTVSQANRQPPGGFGAIPAQSGTPHGGVVSVAESPGSKPNWILPIATVAAEAVSNVLDFDYLMWRPLYWPDEGVSAAIDPALSLARAPTWSNGGRTATITMNTAYKWSGGRPVTAQDVAFDIDLIRAAIKENPANWADYQPGLFPDDLASVSTPDQDTLVLTLKSPVNPSWFYSDELEALQPMPAYAWARAAAGGPILNFTDPANAKKIYDYLVSQENATSSWSANPLWQLVDGPFRLSSFDQDTGAYTMTSNRSYGGPSSHQITALEGVPFNTESDEFNALLAGSVDVGMVPADDVTQVPQLRSDGYNVFGYPDFGWSYALYNFKDATGNFDHIVAQLYFRQAMAHLQNQPAYIKAFMGGAGSPDYGPVPPLPASQYTPRDAADTYPFSLATAKSLLAGHGWRVVPGGTDTCIDPGAGAGQCGGGIPKGTRLAFNLVYYNGLALIQQEVTALAAEARQAGISITLTASSFLNILEDDDDATAPANDDKWAMEDFGNYTQVVYPTTITVFNTDGAYNIGGYSDPKADSLINASVTSANPDAVTAEAAYLTAQQSALFQPNADVVVAWKKSLSGPPDSFANLSQYYLTPESWYFTR